jgi:hypothetical protein
LVLAGSTPALGASPESIAAERPSEPLSVGHDDGVFEICYLDFIDIHLTTGTFVVVNQDIVRFDVCLSSTLYIPLPPSPKIRTHRYVGSARREDQQDPARRPGGYVVSSPLRAAFDRVAADLQIGRDKQTSLAP